MAVRNCFKKNICFYLLFLTLYSARGQNIAPSAEQFWADSMYITRPKLFRPQVRLDSRTSRFDKQTINLYGYDAGIMFKDKLRLTLGYYRINNNLPKEKVINGSSTGLFLAIHCGQINTEILYYNSRYISLGFPWEFAFGKYKLTQSRPETGELLNSQEGFLSYTNFGLSATFTPIRIIGLKGLAGYRKSIYPPEKTFNFNGVFSAIGISIDVQEAIQDIKIYKLQKKYGRNFKGFETYVDLLTD